MPQFDSDN